MITPGARLPWFRLIAMRWFHDYSILPSLVLAALIFIKDKAYRGRRALVWILIVGCVFLATTGFYTLWKAIAVMH